MVHNDLPKLELPDLLAKSNDSTEKFMKSLQGIFEGLITENKVLPIPLPLTSLAPKLGNSSYRFMKDIKSENTKATFTTPRYSKQLIASPNPLKPDTSVQPKHFLIDVSVNTTDNFNRSRLSTMEPVEQAKNFFADKYKSLES